MSVRHLHADVSEDVGADVSEDVGEDVGADVSEDVSADDCEPMSVRLGHLQAGAQARSGRARTRDAWVRAGAADATRCRACTLLIYASGGR
jgi:hypothetical protein